MRVALLAAALAALPLAVGVAAPAHAGGPPPPPYIDRTEWVHWADLSSLRVYPTLAGREASTEFTSPDEAWSEVLVAAPDADLPGMREQFDCHWQLAELAEPGKTSWNLEPWRPEVTPAQMLKAGCNPGNVEEPF
ncbi:DUF2599 domain-containing protein [Mycobacterium sp.]|uniref:DUF2599 domain-containing protein n=1 Tax=Mycobacterium sp. TaxID=1785 RepID=UPI002EE5253C